MSKAKKDQKDPKKTMITKRGEGGRFQEVEVDTEALESFLSGQYQAKESDTRTVQIKAAMIKDNFCSYAYTLEDGPTEGDQIKRTGRNVIHEDMHYKMDVLSRHLALVCEEIVLQNGTDLDEIEKYNSDIHDIGSLEEKISRFNVKGFVLEGIGEKEGVVIIGEKRLSTRQYVQLRSPRVLWLGGYQFIHELRVAVDSVKQEVLEYMNGKMYVPTEDNENPDQQESDFQHSSGQE